MWLLFSVFLLQTDRHRCCLLNTFCELREEEGGKSGVKNHLQQQLELRIVCPAFCRQKNKTNQQQSIDIQSTFNHTPLLLAQPAAVAPCQTPAQLT
jgi:hypothetical protein